MNLLLAIDAGNSFVKCGYHDGRAWQARQRIVLADFCADPLRYISIPPARIVVSNVAGKRVRMALESAFPHLDMQWIEAERQACGVVNRYDPPQQLGADRWAALIAARAMTREACVVVSAGSALTADLLDEEGRFLGGAIAPGFDLMRDALAHGTNAIQPPVGNVTPCPTNTADAVQTGVVYALTGLIARMAAMHEEKHKRPMNCILTGGAAHWIAPHLNRPVQVVDNLVLEGLLLLARKEIRP